MNTATANIDVAQRAFLPLKVAYELRRELAAHASIDLQTRQKATNEFCVKAHNLALLFRRNRTEYRWEQGFPARPGRNDETDIIGSSVPPKELKQWSTLRVVFGTVVKGGGPNGKLSEGRTLLRKGEILVGPAQAHIPR